MSTKTLRKRIALVAVSALGFGLLTSVGANAAYDKTTNGNLSFGSAAAQPGVCSTVAGDATATTGFATAYALSGVSIALEVDTSTGYSVISGNGTFTGQDSTAAFDTLTSTTAHNTSSGGKLYIKTGAVGSAVITLADSDSVSPATKAILNIVASCDNAVYDAGNSYFHAVATDAGTATTNVDETDGSYGLPATKIGNGAAGWISMKLHDVYDVALPKNKSLVATVKSGDAFVAIDTTGTAPAASKATGKSASTLSIAAGTAQVTVVQSVANKPTTAVVEVSYNGTVVGSRTFTFEGPASKINISDVQVGDKGTSGRYRFSVQDDAGNYLRHIKLASDAGVTDGVIVTSATNDSDPAYTGRLGEKTDDTTAANGGAEFTCGGVSGKGKAGVKYVDPDTLAVIKASFDAYCGGKLDTWTLSMDKASYAPGEIATLTVTGKDASGNPVNTKNDEDAFAKVAASFGGMSFVTTPTTTDKFTSGPGTKTYTLTVGTTEGSFAGSFKIAGATDTAAKTVQYKIAAGGSSISNAEVLAAIVKLIASINKQIAALQKLLTKKK